MAAPYYVQCQVAADGIAVAPCGTVEGVALVPVLVDAVPPALDYSQAGDAFAFGLTVVLVPWIIGMVVGSIVRVVRDV